MEGRMAWSRLVLAAVLACCCWCCWWNAEPASAEFHDVKHVVVLMLENRSFDHMLGWLKRVDERIDGTDGTQFNLEDPDDPNSPKWFADDTAHYVDPDPSHSVGGTAEQLFGQRKDTGADPAPMNGFAASAKRNHIPPRDVMSGFNNRSTPVIQTLAQEFAVFDRWYAAVPGPTQVNRLYLHSATSYGYANNDHDMILKGFPQRSFYDNLIDQRVDFGVYFDEIPGVLVLKNMRKIRPLMRMFHISELKYHLQRGKLPQYVFIEPRYFDSDKPANDQHPSHDVSEGERLVKDLYEMFRASPLWEKLLFIVTYDEHGGFYDHVSPPRHVPNPDGRNSTKASDLNFDFTRLGVRIPTVMISPWIPKGTVVHDPPQTTPDPALLAAFDGEAPLSPPKYDHTSIIATAKKLFNIPNFLTRRDAWSGTFEHIFEGVKEPRQDCPMTLPGPPALSNRPQTGDNPLSDFQEELVEMAAALHGISLDKIVMKENEAAQYVKKLVDFFINGIKCNQGSYTNEIVCPDGPIQFATPPIAVEDQ